MKYKKNKRQDEDDFFNFFSNDVFVGKGLLYIGSVESENGEEVGINHRSSEFFIKGLNILHRILPIEKHITIYLNTRGGSYYEGMCIYDAIMEIKKWRKVLIIGYGKVMSMGAIILQAATQRVLQPHCIFMLHYGYTTLSGESKTVERQMEEEKILNKTTEQIFLDRMKEKNKNITLNKVKSLLDRDVYLTAYQAKDMGLIDYVVGDKIYHNGIELIK